MSKANGHGSPHLDPNIGELGVDSIRLGGKRIGHLPLAEQAGAKAQIPGVMAINLENLAEQIRASSPKHDVGYLVGRINEAESNITRFKMAIADTASKADEYTATIALCKHRDMMIGTIPEDAPDRKAQIRALEKQFPPYNVEKMQEQIGQFRESVARFEQAVEQERASITELREVLTLCKKRDSDLKKLGV